MRFEVNLEDLLSYSINLFLDDATERKLSNCSLYFELFLE